MLITNITHSITKFITKYREYIIILLLAVIIRYLAANRFRHETFMNSETKGNMNISTIYVERVTTA